MLRGWVLFFIGILVSTFLGGAIRVLLSPAFVRQWVNDVVVRSQPRFTFEFEEARMSFGRGWMPQVAVELVDLKIRAKDPCVTGSEISVSQVVVPLNLRAIFAGQVKFGDISADQVVYYNRAKRCEGASTLPSLPGATYDIATDITLLENFFQRRWSKEVINTTRYLDEVLVTELRVIQGDDIEPLFYLRDLNLIFYAKKYEADLKFNFWPGVQLVGDQPFGPTKFTFQLASESVKWTADGNLKEGQIHSKGLWNVEQAQYEFELKWRDVPVGNFMALMHLWNISTLRDFKIRNEWLACGFESRGDVRQALKNPLRFDVCEVYGDLGRAQTLAREIKPADFGKVPIVVHTDKMDVRRLSAAFGYEDWTAYLPRLGHFSGELKTNLRGELHADGTVKGIEVYWGDFGLPSARTTIEEANVQAEIKSSQFVLKLNELRGKNLPRGTKLVVDKNDGEMFFAMTAPMIDFSVEWPIVSALSTRLEIENDSAKFTDFNFKFSKNSTLDWQFSALQAGVPVAGQGVLLDDGGLRGAITFKNTPKATFNITGTLREPVATTDQSF